MTKYKKILTQFKNDNLVLFYLWTEYVRLKGKLNLKKYSDKAAINKLYYSKSGRYPNLKIPTLFSEKMQWLKLYYRDPSMEIAADKFRVRELVKEKGYESTLNELIDVFEEKDVIDFNKLPNKFVLKGSHGSGWNLIVNNKSEVKWFLWKRIIKSWLKHNIFWNGREWVYKNIKPRLVCEQFLKDESGHLIDYKFHCFNGEPIYIQANNGRGKGNHAQNFYDLEWNFLPFGKDLTPKKEVVISKPSQLSTMIEMARDYAANFPYVRVDFYEVNKKIIFGELTFFPASGMPDFKPDSYDKIWGDLLILPKNNLIK
jgi:hypothetical protein